MITKIFFQWILIFLLIWKLKYIFQNTLNDQKIKMNGKTIDHVEKENFLIVKKIGSGQKNFKIFR